VAYVLGDNLFDDVKDIQKNGLPPHLDSDNSEVQVADHTLDLLEKGDKPIVSANAYLGAREIVKGLEMGADIIIAGRVADASPVSENLWGFVMCGCLVALTRNPNIAPVTCSTTTSLNVARV
jgi:hypothetical protein